MLIIFSRQTTENWLRKHTFVICRWWCIEKFWFSGSWRLAILRLAWLLIKRRRLSQISSLLSLFEGNYCCSSLTKLSCIGEGDIWHLIVVICVSIYLLLMAYTQLTNIRCIILSCSCWLVIIILKARLAFDDSAARWRWNIAKVILWIITWGLHFWTTFCFLLSIIYR